MKDIYVFDLESMTDDLEIMKREYDYVESFYDLIGG